MSSPRTRIALGVVAVLFAVGLCLGWTPHRTPREAKPLVQRQPERNQAEATETAIPSTVRDPIDDGNVDAFTARTEALRRACDLPLESRCEGGVCAAVVRSPDLDHLLGWLAIVSERPRLVASTLLRDAGVDPSWLPCGEAIDALGDRPIWSVVDPTSRSGEEWWCTVDTIDAAGAAAALCDAMVARRLGSPFEGFSAAEPRRLRFR